MNRFHLSLGLIGGLLVFGPVGWRVLAWERSVPHPVTADSASAGAVLFSHVWQEKDALSPHGDGLGPVFNDRSCAACHHQGGVGGAGGLDHNVTTFLVGFQDGRAPAGQQPREGVLHAQATLDKHRETLNNLDPGLPGISKVKLAQVVEGNGKRGNNLLNLPQHIQLSQRNTPALFGAKLIDEIPERILIAEARRQSVRHGLSPSDTETVPVGRVHRLPDGQIGRFGWKGQTSHLADFVQAACANELGLGNPGQAQPISMSQVNYLAPGLDLTQQQCDELTAFVSSLARPMERAPADANAKAVAHAGKGLFDKIGCADCHVPNLGSVEGLYSDLLLHRMGLQLEGGGAGYGPSQPSIPIASESSRPRPDEWRTTPLWGVADSAPYMHDGRATTLEDAITLHGGQAAAAARRFEQLNGQERLQLVGFLKTLRAP